MLTSSERIPAGNGYGSFLFTNQQALAGRPAPAGFRLAGVMEDEGTLFLRYERGER